MQGALYLENHMVVSAREKIPVFMLTLENQRRCINYKYSDRGNQRRTKETRCEHIGVPTFTAMLMDEHIWKPGSLFYSPKNHLPMFRMMEIDGERIIEVMNHRTGKTAYIHVIAIFELLLDENVWKAA